MVGDRDLGVQKFFNTLSAARILQRLLAGAGRFSRLRVIVFRSLRIIGRTFDF